ARHVWVVTNTPPVAVNQTVTTVKNRAVVITLAATDSDALTYELVDLPAHGFVQFTGADTVRYTPETDFIGVDTFTFRAGDGWSVSTPGTIVVQVNDGAAPSQHVVFLPIASK
ncbi:MAG: Ig-like domain-containing protein, partial [Caldilineaceae bacterium]